MDVDLLSKMIKELILDKDRVVLPGLGCFVAEMVPSTFSDKGYTINPPYRKLSFRSKPDMGDELIDFYTEANGLDRDVACRILGDFIRELRQVIFTKKVVILPGLGRLRATKENHLFFIPEEGLDIYPAGIGLEPISLKTHVETQQEVASAVADLKSIMEEVVVAGVQEDKVEEVVETAEEVVVAVAEEVVEEEVVVEAESSEPVEEVVEVETETVEKPKKSAGKKVMTTMIVLVVLAAVL
jgi:nucleoid DNA-binding protein